MSGGVDSSVAALLLLESGNCECAGATLKLFDGTDGRCCSLTDVNDARDVCGALGIPHYVLNYKAAFERDVMNRFAESYRAGSTPNPCIDCNRFIKFSLLLRRVSEIGFDTLASGHYARIEQSGSRFLLKKAKDRTKDQSYVLYTMTQEQLAQTVFPLGALGKDEVRGIAAAHGLITAHKKDSQDICFVPDGDYGRFIEEHLGLPRSTGAIVDEAGRQIGVHRGFYRYTIGQRRGLGVSAGDGARVYVTATSAQDNRVTLGPETALYSDALLAAELNLIACDRLDRPLRAQVKTRYLQREAAASITQTGAETVRVDFDRPQRAVTPGQAVVFYDDDVVIGGAVITAAVRN